MQIGPLHSEYHARDMRKISHSDTAVTGANFSRRARSGPVNRAREASYLLKWRERSPRVDVADTDTGHGAGSCMIPTLSNHQPRRTDGRGRFELDSTARHGENIGRASHST